MSARLPVELAREENPSLYVHIPVCGTKCRYCDFYSVAGLSTEAIQAVLERTERQLDLFREALQWRALRSIYVGGGTPTRVPPRMLASFLSKLRDAAGPGPLEFSVEANPETLTPELLRALDGSGVTRLSLGIQTLAEAALAAVGRACRRRENQVALELVAREWPGRVSVDLMFGLPLQSREDLYSDIAACADAGAGHVSAYALTLYEDTPLAAAAASGSLTVPDEDEQAAAWDALEDRLFGLGLARYEVSNYAKPGETCRHNEGYWDMLPYLGVGPGAVSTLFDLRGRPVRLNLPKRLDAAAEAVDVEIVGRGEYLGEWFIMGLRTTKGIDIGRFTSTFGIDPAPILEQAAGPLGIGFHSRDGRLSLDPPGLRILDRVLTAILSIIDNYPDISRP